MNLPPYTQVKLVSMLCSLIESGKQHDHAPACECQLCVDLRLADELLDEIEGEIAPAELPVYRPTL